MPAGALPVMHASNCAKLWFFYYTLRHASTGCSYIRQRKHAQSNFIAVQVLCPFKDCVTFIAQSEVPRLVELLVMIQQTSVETYCFLSGMNPMIGSRNCILQ